MKNPVKGSSPKSSSKIIIFLHQIFTTKIIGNKFPCSGNFKHQHIRRERSPLDKTPSHSFIIEKPMSNIHFNIIIPTSSSVVQANFSQQFLYQNCVFISCLPPTSS